MRGTALIIASGCGLVLLLGGACGDPAPAPEPPDAPAGPIHSPSPEPPAPSTAPPDPEPAPPLSGFPGDPAYADSFAELHAMRLAALQRLHGTDRPPHALGLTPYADTVAVGLAEPYRLTSPGFELVSDVPPGEMRVYMSKEDPFDFTFASLPKRSPDALERDAYEKLRNGKELVRIRDGLKIRVLGAVRVEGPCLRCHNVPAGTLYGAFSYTFHETPDD
ncbi:MAG: hypothetical protein ACLFTT_16415 [Candidatus Hydrogenedentota bacterium]